MSELTYFINEKMKVLLIIKEYQLGIDGVNVCPLNQQEIASLVPCSKLKVNQMLKELIDDGYVETMRSKGRYILTDRAIRAIRAIISES